MTQAFNPLDYLSLARELLNHGGFEEARRRAAVSRAYYALFLYAREKVGYTSKDHMHQQVINKIKGQKGFRSTAEKLDSLRRLRVIADYDLIPVEVSDRDWDINWTQAQALIDHVLPRLQKMT